MKPAHRRRPARPLLVIGWDAATPELIEPWMADGTLPNLAGLARRGCSTKLRSLIHPLSPAAWTSAFTGLNPGRHGIWDFGQRESGSYEVHPTGAHMRSGATLWDIAGDCGLRSAVINVPLTHPTGPVQGHFVPGVGAATLDGATWPTSLADRIALEVPTYRIDANSFEQPDPAAFLADVAEMAEARARLAERLLVAERPDLLVCVFVSADRVQHAFWKQARLPWSEPDRADWRFADSIRDCYRQLDRALGRLLDAAGPDATTLVISDHGFGELAGDIYLNAVLEELGLLVVRRRRQGLLDRLLGRPAPAASLADVDWERTRAFSAGLFGNVWLNLRGREPRGQVETGPEAEALLQTIQARLLELREPDGRAPLVQAVFRGAELYRGERCDVAPDLVVVPRDYRWMTRAGCEIGPPGQLTAEPAVRHTGNHRMDGILVAGGPGIAAGAPGTRSLLDLTPTALALLGVEVPRGLDGRPMDGVLSCDVGWTDELPWRDPGPRRSDDFEAMQAQLEGLGYLVR